jgi:hypothetical protein
MKTLEQSGGMLSAMLKICARVGECEANLRISSIKQASERTSRGAVRLLSRYMISTPQWAWINWLIALLCRGVPSALGGVAGRRQSRRQPVRESHDNERWALLAKVRHDATVARIEVGMIKGAAIAVDDAVSRAASHSADARIMDSGARQRVGGGHDGDRRCGARDLSAPALHFALHARILVAPLIVDVDLRDAKDVASRAAARPISEARARLDHNL